MSESSDGPTDRNPPVPAHLAAAVEQLVQVYQDLKRNLGSDPSLEELIEAMYPLPQESTLSQTIVDWKRAVHASAVCQLLDFARGQVTLKPRPDEMEEQTSSEGSRRLLDRMQSVLEVLEDFEKEVLEMRYGLLDGRPRTLEEVGEETKLSRERIRQIETIAMERLRVSRTPDPRGLIRRPRAEPKRKPPTGPALIIDLAAYRERRRPKPPPPSDREVMLGLWIEARRFARCLSSDETSDGRFTDLKDQIVEHIQERYDFYAHENEVSIGFSGVGAIWEILERREGVVPETEALVVDYETGELRKQTLEVLSIAELFEKAEKELTEAIAENQRGGVS